MCFVVGALDHLLGVGPAHRVGGADGWFVTGAEPDLDPDLAPADYLGLILGFVAPIGCTPAQQAVIKETLTDYGTRLGLCLAKAGLAWCREISPFWLRYKRTVSHEAFV